ncbi:nucleotidyltransferase domain-containing protein [Candidatus Woesearchaeota archaeon]|nr:nucleotidyltransferase domain-containing protein [Candidatus Woesearchaeota archaeon]
MLDNLLGNKTNILVLRFLTKFQNQFFPIEEIANEVGAGLRNVYDSLSILTNENFLKTKVSKGRVYYKFDVDSNVKRLILDLFEEERKRLLFKTNTLYKTLSEIELRTIKLLGSNLVDIFLFGSIAKGRDTINSDIDLCILVKEKDPKLLDKIRTIQFDDKFKQDIQIHVFTSTEFIDGDKNENPLIKSIIRDGLSLKIGR